MLVKNQQHLLVHVDQFRSRIEPEYVEIEEELMIKRKVKPLISTVEQKWVCKKVIVNRQKRLVNKMTLHLDHT